MKKLFALVLTVFATARIAANEEATPVFTDVVTDATVEEVVTVTRKVKPTETTNTDATTEVALDMATVAEEAK